MKIECLENSEKEKYIAEVIKREHFLRDVQVLPLEDKFNFEGWLSNFSQLNDKYIAAKILANFIYYPKKMVDRLMYDSVGAATSILAKKFSIGDRRRYHKYNVFYSYIPGERPNPTDSGYLFLREVRDFLHVPQNQIVQFGELRDLIYSELKADSAIVFCDDIIGSGAQCITALNMPRKKGAEFSIYDACCSRGVHLAYAPIIANNFGVERIKKLMPKLLVTPAHELSDQYCLFSPNCICWDGDSDMFESGVEFLLRIHGNLGIAEDESKTISARGYGNQGLFIGFEHGIPDACPAFFFYHEKGWIPLMERVYERD